MTWIRTLGEDEVTGPLREKYQADLDALGFVMEATKAFSARPELVLAYRDIEAAVWGTPGLTRRERSLIHLLISERIHSTYCVLVYGARLEGELGGPGGLRAFLRDHRNAGLSEREVAILDYALEVVVGHPREAHMARLREIGLDDAAILDVAFTAALRLFGSRLYDALGVETDPFFLEQTDLVEAVARGDDPGH
jgi:uncharacterized peroxidase-related enzyme